MDFTLGEELETVRGLAREIFTDHATTERVRAAEAGENRIDAELWEQLARAGLLGTVIDEDDGGVGLGIGGLCVLLQEQGRVVAPVPLWSAAVAALAIAEYGTPQQRAAVLPGVVDGSERITVALEEFGPVAAAEPACVAKSDGSRWRLTGVKAVVPTPFGADRVLVAAMTEQGPGLFLTATDAEDLRWEHCETTDHDAGGNLQLDGALAEAVGAPGGGVLDMVLRWAEVALSALQLGVAEGALAHAAEYLRERVQFDRPLGSLQAVQHQLADCYIETDAMRVTLWQAVQAVTELTDGHAPASAVLVAKWWAGDSGLNVVHRVQHVHGGIGVDTDYPVHRHFLWGKQISGLLGGPSATLDRLGSVLVESGART
ncbi:acyl-CoA dehydrogenase family protein [Haloactinomyces albus]|uniref:Acyl-CoA dehydrogenase n=1 Tax=Haloactinomyces albus TaxID=1352928 RepID=A0AAE4CMY2_9ACTN|nr:acyl-CoA dehydrogenase family protein [Haloactinomyces albus]MDR7303910.1 acyl-CoA dehydrogenase [Haloactinomyces albus]